MATAQQVCHTPEPVQHRHLLLKTNILCISEAGLHLPAALGLEHGRPEVVFTGDLEAVGCEVQHLLCRGMAAIYKP